MFSKESPECGLDFQESGASDESLFAGQNAYIVSTLSAARDYMDGGLEALIYDIDDRDSYSLLSVSGETIATNARPFYGCRC